MGGSDSKERSVLGDDFSRIFRLGRLMGTGQFGHVHVILPRAKKSGKKTPNGDELYAVKVLSKRSMLSKPNVDHVMASVFSERDLLIDCHHPLLVNNHASWQTPVNLCIMMDLMKGGDLSYHIGSHKRLTEDRTKFYTAQILCVLKFLKDKSIIHRDLKPDNILLDHLGNCHVADFGIAVKYDPEKPPKSCAGTPPFMAPEVLTKENYDYGVDMWSLAVQTYLCMAGGYPFPSLPKDREKWASHAEVLLDAERIKFGSLSSDCIDFLKKVFVAQDERITVEEALEHPWFSDIDFAAIDDMTATTPFTPKKKANVNGAVGLSEFASQLEGNAAHKEEPITEEDQKKFRGFDWIPEDIEKELTQAKGKKGRGNTETGSGGVVSRNNSSGSLNESRGSGKDSRNASRKNSPQSSPRGDSAEGSE
eukprot:TRINITY_DN16637_c0_g1_i2.p1 TRINITY_DN16637_c0_g1~~TRINITY_DN16637_c0_g1_i2.p1  ORF type:complete len:421 (-),score=107.36 TRINITY_DN16637_c0_g1_i2:385-1647(-)